MFGMLLVLPEEGEAGFQKRFQFGIVSARNEGAAKRVVHCSMIGDLVLDISLVERRTIKAVELAHLLLCLFGKRCACSICFRRDAELLHQCQRLIIYRSEEHTSELQSLMRISSAVFCLKKKQREKT